MRMPGAVAVLVLLFSSPFPVVAQEDEFERLDRRISLKLVDTVTKPIFQLFAEILGAELGDQYEPEGTVNLVFDNVTVRTSLNVFCESAGCHWELSPGEIPVLNFYSADNALEEKLTRAAETRLSLDLKEAKANLVFRMFSEILRTKLAFDLPIEGRVVTIKRNDETVSELLNEVCRDLGCRWRLVGDGPVTLTVTPAKG